MGTLDPTVQLETMLTDIHRLTPAERLISAYVSVRDIPYGSANNPNPFDVLQKNRGTAKGKHILLKMILENMGYEVKQFWCKHDFSKMPLKSWPDALKEFRGKHITGYHDFLKVKIGRKWVRVDATFDKALRALGFPVPDWDGTTDLPLPVAAEEEFPVEAPIDDHRRRLVAALPEEMQQQRKLFLKTLKRWLEEQRKALA